MQYLDEKDRFYDARVFLVACETRDVCKGLNGEA
jgi:hypothetical protein